MSTIPSGPLKVIHGKLLAGYLQPSVQPVVAENASHSQRRRKMQTTQKSTASARHETLNIEETQNRSRKEERFKNTVVIQMECLFVKCAVQISFYWRIKIPIKIINVVDCWSSCCFCISQSCVLLFPFLVSGVSSGPWCQSAHQSAGLLLHCLAA